VLEPPSTSLLKTLATLKLCTPRDLRRCRRHVRRMTRDLPAFDSIWIDALVQSRRLTAFQGQCLEDNQADRLQVGPCLLLERMGGSFTADTFLARRADAEDVCVLKLTSVAPEDVRSSSERIGRLVKMARHFEHAAIVLPQATQTIEWPTPREMRLVTISRHVSGPNLSELLIRRGRFPIAVVVEIGRQLLDGLVALEACGLVHGDISLKNVRITNRGQAVLVDAGLVSELRPRFSFHTLRSPDHYDGLAPERISAGLPPSSSSDLYALGCLLWHLLAGRPPFVAGDPLAKIAAHQTRAIDDVREWVPDTPDWLAETLLRWTAFNPAVRPRSLRDAAADIGSPQRSGRKCLKQFRGEFDRAAPPRQGIESNSRWPWTVAAIFVLSGAVLSMFDQGARGFVLSLARPNATAVDSPSDVSQHTVQRSPATSEFTAPQTLPTPDAAGQIRLALGGRYVAEEVSVRGLLHLAGDPAAPAQIVVGERALSLLAEQITIQHVRFVRADSTNDRVPPLLMAECQRLQISDCRFETEDSDETTPSRRETAMAWRPSSSARNRDSHIALQNVVHLGRGATLFLQSPPRRFAAMNVLKSGNGDFVQWIDGVRSDWQIELTNVTLRESGPLLRCWQGQTGLPLGRLTLTATGCVFDLASIRASHSSARPQPALVAWMLDRLPPNWNTAIDWQLSGTLVRPEIAVVTRIDPKTGQRTPVDESQLEIDGLIAVPLEFVGTDARDPSASLLRPFDAPLPASVSVGIDAGKLPKP
jgi:serine/threonine protein kinase